jgi:hypothetical protein
MYLLFKSQIQPLDPLSPDLGGGMKTKSSSSQNESTKAILF